jgi:DnaJ-class molecular chaperone
MRPKINTPPSVDITDSFTTCPNCGGKYWVGTWHFCPVRQTAVKCPVCEGHGKINDFSNLGGTTVLIVCHGCDGKGWVKV